METNNFRVYAQGACRIIKTRPTETSIKRVIAASRKKHLGGNVIIIARYNWLKSQKLEVPEIPLVLNLCLTIKNGKLIRAFYSNDLTHIIKKQRYVIRVLN